MARDIASIDQMLSAHRHRISHINDVLNNDRYFLEEKTRLESLVNDSQNKLTYLLHLRNDGIDLKAGLFDAIETLKVERVQLANAAGIARLKELSETIRAVQELQELQTV